jgi:hypothetical protein
LEKLAMPEKPDEPSGFFRFDCPRRERQTRQAAGWTVAAPIEPRLASSKSERNSASQTIADLMLAEIESR